VNAIHTDVILELDLARAFEFTKDSCTPNIHNALLGDGCTCMPSRNLFESVRSTVLTHFVLWLPGVNSHRSELVLVRIVSNLTKVVRSTCPKLASVALLGIVSQQERMILAAGDHVD